MTALADVVIERKEVIPTWFGIGGGAERFAAPQTVEQLRRCVQIDPALRVLGDGANLLVDDAGVSELVVVLTAQAMAEVRWTGTAVSAGAGANLPKLINEAARRGLGGLEGLAGIPASIGGAVRMNAGGTFGQIADAVARVHGLRRDGSDVVLERGEIDFSYRHSGLDDLIITGVELALTPEEPKALRAKVREVMAYKAKSQPMAERSAGCVFKNPTLGTTIDGIGAAGQRVSAGMLTDRAGCKGLAVGGASVSQRHGNFIVTDPRAARARHVIDLMAQITRRVREAFGVELQPEVVIWS